MGTLLLFAALRISGQAAAIWTSARYAGGTLIGGETSTIIITGKVTH